MYYEAGAFVRYMYVASTCTSFINWVFKFRDSILTGIGQQHFYGKWYVALKPLNLSHNK